MCTVSFGETEFVSWCIRHRLTSSLQLHGPGRFLVPGFRHPLSSDHRPTLQRKIFIFIVFTRDGTLLRFEGTSAFCLRSHNNKVESIKLFPIFRWFIIVHIIHQSSSTFNALESAIRASNNDVIARTPKQHFVSSTLTYY